jgi:acetyltransferase-like isoleucine patch superfamily enzyme
MSARRPLLIFPCNGNGLEALDCLGDEFECIGFVDDTLEKQRAGAFGLPVLSRSALADRPHVAVLAVPGGPASYQARRQVIEGLSVSPERFATVIHPGAHVSKLAQVGHNVLVMAGAVITSNAVIGDHVCVLPNTVIHHDVTVGNFSLIGANVAIAGGVRHQREERLAHRCTRIDRARQQCHSRCARRHGGRGQSCPPDRQTNLNGNGLKDLE